MKFRHVNEVCVFNLFSFVRLIVDNSLCGLKITICTCLLAGRSGNVFVKTVKVINVDPALSTYGERRIKQYLLESKSKGNITLWVFFKE
jgi:hypothetical protein